MANVDVNRVGKPSETQDGDGDIVNPYAEKSVTNDTALIVEGEKLYVSRAVLSLVSPVFRAMFELDMEEKQMDEIPLPEKYLDDMIEFLLCIYPDTRKPITGRNAFFLVPLFDEYQVDQLKAQCDSVLARSLRGVIGRVITQEILVFELLLLASTYNLSNLKNRCLQLASVKKTSHLKEMLKKYPLPDAVQSRLWELVTEERDKTMDSFLDMWELIPTKHMENVTIQPQDVVHVGVGRKRKLTYTVSTQLKQSPTLADLSQYSKAIELASHNRFRDILVILVELYASELRQKGSSKFRLLQSSGLNDTLKEIVFEKLNEKD